MYNSMRFPLISNPSSSSFAFFEVQYIVEKDDKILHNIPEPFLVHYWLGGKAALAATSSASVVRVNVSDFANSTHYIFQLRPAELEFIKMGNKSGSMGNKSSLDKITYSQREDRLSTPRVNLVRWGRSRPPKRPPRPRDRDRERLRL